MAIASVPTQTRAPFYLPFDEVNNAGAIHAKLRGIIGCIQSASVSNETPEPGAIPNACWCALDLLEELNEIVSLRQPQEGLTQSVGGES